MSHLLVFSAVAVLLVHWCASDVGAGEYRVRVDAGKVERRDALVAVDVPGEPATAPAKRQWIKVTLRPGESATYALPRSATTAPNTAMSARDDGRDVLRLRAGDRDLLVYQGGAGTLPPGYDESFRRGGYIRSVLTPTGALVTDDYPPGHKHHHGVWSPWTKTAFEGRRPDFWNMGDRTGTVKAVSAHITETGPVVAGLEARHRMIDLSAKPDPKPAIDEHWSVLAYTSRIGSGDSARPCNVFDLVITQTCATDSPLILPEYHYGGLGFRGNRQWDGAGKCRFLTSEGKTGVDGNTTRARWCHVGGDIDGKAAGLAIFCHPDNFRFPQPIRVHPHEPFFCFVPSQLGEWRIEPGMPYVARYRFVVADGDPEPKEIERLWRDYAEPVSVLLVSQ
jgi:hypothetical protein